MQVKSEKELVGSSNDASIRRSHFAAIRQFISSCDPERVAEIEEKYAVLKAWQWDEIKSTEQGYGQLEGFTPATVAGRVTARAVVTHRRKTSEPDVDPAVLMANPDWCQVCGSSDARCICCG